jgi:hypothetical protein
MEAVTLRDWTAPVSVGRGRLRRQHLEIRGPAGADPPIRSRQRHADPLQGPAQTQGLGLRDRQAINDAQSATWSGSPPGDHHARDAARRNRVRTDLSLRNLRDRSPKPAPKRSDALGREQTMARILLLRPTAGRLRFQPRPHRTQLTPSSAERAPENTGARKRRHPEESSALDRTLNSCLLQRSADRQRLEGLAGLDQNRGRVCSGLKAPHDHIDVERV